MNINKDNYESFFIDYIDGNLTAHETASLMIFLAENPDLDMEISHMDKINLQPNKVIFTNKESLKRTEEIIPGSFDDKCIAYLENDLSLKERHDFEELINENLENKREFNKYKSTKLIANNTIKYTNKKSLKKPLVFNMKRAQFISYISSAAAVILFLIAFNLYNKSVEEDNYSKVEYSYLDQSMIDRVKNAIENFNDGFIPDLM